MMECNPSLLDSGIPTIDWIATHLRVSWLTPLILAISDLGKEGQVIFTVALAYWLWNKRYTTYLGYAMFTALLLNLLIKGWVMECRPPQTYWLEMVHNSFSFPSGHTQVATPLWMGFAYYIRQNNKWLAWLFFIIGLLIGLSRPYLGVHFVHDIVVGGVLGIAIFSLFILSERKNWQPLQQLPFVKSALLMCMLMSIYAIVLRQISPSIIKAISAFIGFWFGCQCDNRWLHFSNPTRLVSRLLISAIGIAGTIFIWKGPSLVQNLPLAFTAMQYALLGWWITFATPWIYHRFTRTK